MHYVEASHCPEMEKRLRGLSAIMCTQCTNGVTQTPSAFKQAGVHHTAIACTEVGTGQSLSLQITVFGRCKSPMAAVPVMMRAEDDNLAGSGDVALLSPSTLPWRLLPLDPAATA
ncbi:hypothetical protein E2C01_001454 [Portunus trituberculatus]|uniref:Uncharacterized protein n=1 Tax=Portunus trituberculatus TaxID=210409 RepID=A0A5B7CHB7_PORTR|nr:hypothetical protein [Portunus trituberculatus]